MKPVTKPKFSDSTAMIRIKSKCSCTLCGSLIYSQNACKTLHHAYVRRNALISNLNKSSSKKQTVNTNYDKKTFAACVNIVNKFKQVWILKTNRINKK